MVNPSYLLMTCSKITDLPRGCVRESFERLPNSTMLQSHILLNCEQRHVISLILRDRNATHQITSSDYKQEKDLRNPTIKFRLKLFFAASKDSARRLISAFEDMMRFRNRNRRCHTHTLPCYNSSVESLPLMLAFKHFY